MNMTWKRHCVPIFKSLNKLTPMHFIMAYRINVFLLGGSSPFSDTWTVRTAKSNYI